MFNFALNTDDFHEGFTSSLMSSYVMFLFKMSFTALYHTTTTQTRLILINFFLGIVCRTKFYSTVSYQQALQLVIPKQPLIQFALEWHMIEGKGLGYKRGNGEPEMVF